MNMIPSLCNGCGKDIQINQKEFTDPDAHMCSTCLINLYMYGGVGGMPAVPRNPGPTVVNKDAETEFDPETEEEEALCNDELFEELEDPPGLLEPSCECGAAKLNSKIHSDWCPLVMERFKDIEN